MNFTDAVRELAEGRCESVKREGWGIGIDADNEGRLSLPANWLSIKDVLADDWQLVNPKPVMEDVPVVRWAKFNPTSLNPWLGSTSSESQANEWLKRNPGCQIIRLAGNYSRPVAKKVKRREEVKLYNIGDAFLASPTDSSIDIPLKAKLFAEWEI